MKVKNIKTPSWQKTVIHWIALKRPNISQHNLQQLKVTQFFKRELTRVSSSQHVAHVQEIA